MNGVYTKVKKDQASYTVGRYERTDEFGLVWWAVMVNGQLSMGSGCAGTSDVYANGNYADYNDNTGWAWFATTESTGNDFWKVAGGQDLVDASAATRPRATEPPSSSARRTSDSTGTGTLPNG